MVLSPRSATTADESLVRDLRCGRHAAFERLYGTYRAPIYNLCARIIGDREEAQDVTQEVFIKAFSKVPTEDDLALRPWLYRVATNACLNHLRSRGRSGGDGLEVEEIAAPVDGFAQSQTVSDVEETLQRLNERYRTALVLKDLHGLPSAEIASVLELPRGSTDVLVHRARSAFKRVFAEVSGGGAPAPASLGLVLGPLAVPAALHLMPPVPHAAVAPPAPHAPVAPPVHPLPPLGDPSAGLLAKLSTALGSKVAIAAIAAGLVAGGGLTAEQLVSHAHRLSAPPTAQAASTATATTFASHQAASHDRREHWARHGCPSGDASCSADHAGSGHDAHDGGSAQHDASGTTHDSTTAHAADGDTGTHEAQAMGTTSDGGSHDTMHDGGSE